MAKLILVFFACLALIQFIKPLGLPGLRRRKDAWKLAVIGLLVALASVAVIAGMQSAGAG